MKITGFLYLTREWDKSWKIFVHSSMFWNLPTQTVVKDLLMQFLGVGASGYGVSQVVWVQNYTVSTSDADIDKCIEFRF